MTFLDFLTNIIEITGNSTVDWILLSIIGVISFSIAFGIVGTVFRAIGKYDSDAMHEIHLGIRIIAFLVLCVIFISIVKLFSWLFSLPWWVYVIGIVVILVIVVLVGIIIYKKKTK